MVSPAFITIYDVSVFISCRSHILEKMLTTCQCSKYWCTHVPLYLPWDGLYSFGIAVHCCWFAKTMPDLMVSFYFCIETISKKMSNSKKEVCDSIKSCRQRWSMWNRWKNGSVCCLVLSATCEGMLMIWSRWSSPNDLVWKTTSKRQSDEVKKVAWKGIYEVIQRK